MPVRSRSLSLFLLLATAMLASVACRGTSTAGGAEARSDKPRITQPTAAPDDIAQAVQGNNAFAFDLYQALRTNEPGNVFFSPYSISTALAMVYAGARGDTEAQISRTLHFMAQGKQHAAMNAIAVALANAAKQTPGEGGDPLQLEIANSVWAQRDYDFASAFLDALAVYYGAGVHVADFKANPEGSRKALNELVSQETHERIPELIPQGIIDDTTKLIVANTIFFKASWQVAFSPNLTIDRPFHLLDRSQLQTPMMSLDDEFAYAQLDGAQAVRLPYAGGRTSMLAIVPDEGKFESFEAALKAPAIDVAVESLRRTTVHLVMPKFDFASEFSLSAALKALGMPLAFDENRADFSGMNARGEPDLVVKEVVHKANITVNEHGTEAAAATGGIGRVTSAPAGPVSLTIDRPFIFLVRDDVTGAILFAGRVVNPTAS